MEKFIKISKLADLKKIKNPVKFLAGGTDIYPLLKDGFLENEFFCDISGIKELKETKIKKDVLEIGALVTFSDVIENPVFKKYANALYESALVMGSPQIRNRATLGGNIANASPSGDSIPPLFVLKAKIKTNLRTVDIDRFFMGPKKTILKKNELITRIIIPKEQKESYFMKVGPRKALAISKVSVAMAFKMQKGVLKDVRVALGAVGPTVLRAKKTEDFLEGKHLSDRIIKKAGEIVSSEAMPIDDFRSLAVYRRKVAGSILEKILEGRLKWVR
ncbi:MAG: xanthine dehydrogenase family protein subunit M [Elusimicrobia bacterium]|nr:xanthine dehydrogenase family protein subunit M [Elusimicrobiota bacterium]